ncbi:MAG TPA: hypothetical protein DEA08_03235 [Planctomycetes bacterium]|nr:hypothetical protein [Planctomycetota bacterium]
MDAFDLQLHIDPGLVHRILDQFALSPSGAHGATHWARVLANGTRLAAQTGARVEVVQLFALFHDARRINEGADPEHGQRGADLAREKLGAWFELSAADMDRLYDACAYHSDGRTDHPDVTVQTCWDADRLDLPRVGVSVDKRYLCTLAAKQRELREWAGERGSRLLVPDFYRDEWGLSYTPPKWARAR